MLHELLGDSGAERPVSTVIEAGAEAMAAAGAEIVDVGETDLRSFLEDASVIGLEFRRDFDAYLAETPGAPVRTLAELVEQGLYHEIIDGGLRSSLEVETLDTDDYRDRLVRRVEARAAVLRLLDEHDLTAFVYPTIRQTARPVGLAQPGSNCALSAITGLPAITVPAGYATDGMPVGLEMIGREFAESDLIRLAYAFEQATGHRRPPDSAPSLVSPPPPVVIEAAAEANGAGLRGRFELDRARRELVYSVSAYGVPAEDVLFVHLHRAVEGGGAGPVAHLLGGARACAVVRPAATVGPRPREPPGRRALCRRAPRREPVRDPSRPRVAGGLRGRET